MTAPLQSELPLSAARLKKPMLKRDGAKNVLDMEDWQLEAAIDRLDGVLNVASKKAARRDLRFVVVCLEEFKRGLIVPRDEHQLAELIFGKAQRYVRAQWVKSRLMVHATHFYDLAEEKVIRLARGSRPQCGPGGSAVVEWDSLVTFIKQRRIA